VRKVYMCYTVIRYTMVEEDQDWEKFERRMEELSRKLERLSEVIEESLAKSLSRAVKKTARMSIITPGTTVEMRAGPEGVVIRRPIPIRGLDRRLYERIRDLAAETGRTVGQVMNEAMRFYLIHVDLVELERERERILERLREISVPGTLEDEEVREILKKEYLEMLSEVKRRISELKSKKSDQEGE